MAAKRKKAGRPRVYGSGRKEFKLCLPMPLFKSIETRAQENGGRDISSLIREYIEKGIAAEKAA